MKKKVLSLLTALCLMLTLAPAALAAGVTVTTEDQLTTALSNAAAGDTITLDADLTLTSTLSVGKAVTIDGGTGKHTLTAPANQNAINISASGVVLKNLKVMANGSGYAVNATGQNLTVNGCEIQAVNRGISFYPTNGAGASLTVAGTTIKNPNISNYDTTTQAGDCRGIATSSIRGGTVTITNCQILGYGYSINAQVPNDNTGLRDGNNTVFYITNTTIKGWTALNVWSANTDFIFTNCTLVGISRLNGDSNNYATVNVNAGIYANNQSNASFASKIKFVGGSVSSYQYGTAIQAPFFVDYERLTQFEFAQNARKKVQVNVYTPSGVDGSVFAFLLAAQAQMQDYMTNKVSGTQNMNVSYLTISNANAASVLSEPSGSMYTSYESALQGGAQQ